MMPAPDLERRARRPHRRDLVTSRDIVHHTGASYRKVDYWVRQSILQPATTSAGSGVPRTFHRRELTVAAVTARLAAAGLTGPLLREVADAVRWGATEIVWHDVGVRIERLGPADTPPLILIIRAHPEEVPA